MNIHPATRLSGLGLGGTSMETEALDIASGERAATIVDSQQGSRPSMTAGLSKFGQAKQVIDMWVECFLKRIGAAHGAP